MKNFLTIFLLLMTQITLAATCPSISEIKKHQLQGWVAYDAVTGKQLTNDRLKKYTLSISKFSLAEAVKTKHSIAMHCFYKDKFGSNMQAFLTKKNFGPTAELPYWYQVSGSMQCAAGIQKCFFIRKAAHAALAMNE